MMHAALGTLAASLLMLVIATFVVSWYPVSAITLIACSGVAAIRASWIAALDQL